MRALEKKHPTLVNRTEEVEPWIRAVAHQMRAAAKNGAYGVLRVEFRDGHIRRATLERSINRPEVLEQLVEPSIERTES